MIENLSAITRVMTTKIDLGINSKKVVEESVAVEGPIDLYINEEQILTFFASPMQKKELAIGFLLDEGIVKKLNQIKKIEIKDDSIKIDTISNVKTRIDAFKVIRKIDTACGSTENFFKLLDRLDRPIVKSDYSVRADEISRMVDELNKESKIFHLTGGIHSAAIFLDGVLVAFSEDIGRHNAVDKVIGASFLKKIDFGKCVLVTSGRQPADIVMKTARIGIPIAASISGPISSGIVVAKKTGVTLVCFARGRRMNIYSIPERIIFHKIS